MSNVSGLHFGAAALAARSGAALALLMPVSKRFSFG